MFININKDDSDVLKFIIKQFGGKISLNYDNNVTLCLIGSYLENNQLTSSFNTACVHFTYIYFCYKFYFKINPDFFLIDKMEKSNSENLISSVFKQQYNEIKAFYKLEDYKIKINNQSITNKNENNLENMDEIGNLKKPAIINDLEYYIK